MNDDFLYKRQEEPSPEFVAGLRESLAAMELPEKAKRKNGQRRFSWKAVAAVFALIMASFFIWNMPEVHIPVLQMIYGNHAGDVLQNAQETLGFELPEIPNGYYLSTIRFADVIGSYDVDIFDWGNIEQWKFEPSYRLIVFWMNYRGDCVIRLTLDYLPRESDEEWNTEYYNYLDERSDKVEVIQFNDNTSGLLRSLTSYNVAYGMLIEWQYERVGYNIESSLDCMSREEFIELAQSTLPNTP